MTILLIVILVVQFITLALVIAGVASTKYAHEDNLKLQESHYKLFSAFYDCKAKVDNIAVTIGEDDEEDDDEQSEKEEKDKESEQH